MNLFFDQYLCEDFNYFYFGSICLHLNFNLCWNFYNIDNLDSSYFILRAWFQVNLCRYLDEIVNLCFDCLFYLRYNVDFCWNFHKVQNIYFGDNIVFH